MLYTAYEVRVVHFFMKMPMNSAREQSPLLDAITMLHHKRKINHNTRIGAAEEQR